MILLLAACAGASLGQSDSAADKSRVLTPEVALNLRSISDLQFSPDGARLAFVVTEPAKGTGRPRHIWVCDKQAGAARQFTYSAKSESAPRWSPDGKQLAFLSDRGDEQQIYLMRGDVGEGIALTKGKRGIKSFEWSPDAKQIAFLAPDAKTDAEEKKEKDKDDAHVADKEGNRSPAIGREHRANFQRSDFGRDDEAPDCSARAVSRAANFAEREWRELRGFARGWSRAA
jgi:dipeptidyl aminopeptidase/acylaminoacyl peptidase